MVPSERQFGAPDPRLFIFLNMIISNGGCFEMEAECIDYSEWKELCTTIHY